MTHTPPKHATNDRPPPDKRQGSRQARDRFEFPNHRWPPKVYPQKPPTPPPRTRPVAYAAPPSRSPLGSPARDTSRWSWRPRTRRRNAAHAGNLPSREARSAGGKSSTGWCSAGRSARRGNDEAASSHATGGPEDIYLGGEVGGQAARASVYSARAWRKRGKPLRLHSWTGKNVAICRKCYIKGLQ